MAEEFPYDLKLETTIIQHMLADADSRQKFVRSVSPDQFFVAEHQVIWKAIRALLDQKLDYDPDTLRRLVFEVGGNQGVVDHLAGIEPKRVAVANIRYHITSLQWD